MSVGLLFAFVAAGLRPFWQAKSNNKKINKG